MDTPSWHWEHITHVAYVGNGDPWPFPGNVLVSGEWVDNYRRKIIRIEPYREVQGGGGGGTHSSYRTHSDKTVGLAVWWIEKVQVQNFPPAPLPDPEPSDYEKVREELQV